MLNLNKVAVTGGLSCGKSSVCLILKELGAYTISADEIVHQLLSSDTNLCQEVVNLLGTGILVNDRIDRSRIANIVFFEPDLLKALEDLLHPAVYDKIEQEYQIQSNSDIKPSLFVAEIPLLFETEGEKNYHYTVAVVANPQLSFQRFRESTGENQESFDQRMSRQWPLIDKIAKADYAIMNNGLLSDLQQTTKELYNELIQNP